MSDRLCPMEAIMWRVGQDATLRMTVGALMIVDRSPTEAALAERVSRAVHREPRLRRRPDDDVSLTSTPYWVDDDEQDIDRHVRTLSVAAPGSLRQVLDLVSLIESVPFDPERSPWDLTLVEGLEGGQAALYFRAHHVLTDGLGGIELISLLLDPPELAPEPTATPASTPMPAAVPDHESSANGDRHFGTMTMTIDVPGVMRRVVDGVNAARSIDPIDSAVRGLQRALNVANSVSRQVMVTGGPLLASSDSRSLLSRFEVLSIEDTRRTALALGGSRNDLLIAASATALGMYHERLGEQSLMLRLATPAGARRHEDGNWFVPTRLEIPTAVGRPGPQFGIVVERLSQARREPALRVVPTLASAIRRLPSRFLFPVLHAQTESVDLAATALPGLRRVRRICGATIQGLYPFGPRLGCPLNVSAFGNDGRLDIGMALDMDAIAEPQLLIDCMREAFDSFLPVAADQPPKAAKGTAAVGH